MVDFNNETTISTPAVDIIRVLILQRRNDVIESIEHYHKIGGNDNDLDVVKSRIFSLYLEVEGVVDKGFKLSGLTFESYYKLIFSSDFSGLLNIFKDLNLLLYNINLTKIDNKPDYDTTNIEVENKVHNL